MFQHILSSLLILLLLINQGLSLAHAHCESGTKGPDGQLNQPHFHLGGSAHSHHTVDRSASDKTATGSNGEAHWVVPPESDHDSDAVYCSGPQVLTPRGNADNGQLAKCVAGLMWLNAAVVIKPACAAPLHIHAFEPGAACPIYLRTLCLRI